MEQQQTNSVNYYSLVDDVVKYRDDDNMVCRRYCEILFITERVCFAAVQVPTSRRRAKQVDWSHPELQVSARQVLTCTLMFSIHQQINLLWNVNNSRS